MAVAIDTTAIEDEGLLREMNSLVLNIRRNISVIAEFTRTMINEIPYTDVTDAICMIGILSYWLCPIRPTGIARKERFDRKYSIETQRTGATIIFRHLDRRIINAKNRPKRPK
jgi:hypothetical protein